MLLVQEKNHNCHKLTRVKHYFCYLTKQSEYCGWSVKSSVQSPQFRILARRECTFGVDDFWFSASTTSMEILSVKSIIPNDWGRSISSDLRSSSGYFYPSALDHSLSILSHSSSSSHAQTL